MHEYRSLDAYLAKQSGPDTASHEERSVRNGLVGTGAVFGRRERGGNNG